MDNFNFDDNYDSIPKLNKRQKKMQEKKGFRKAKRKTMIFYSNLKA